jgi:hypothetical protein
VRDDALYKIAIALELDSRLSLGTRKMRDCSIIILVVATHNLKVRRDAPYKIAIALIPPSTAIYKSKYERRKLTSYPNATVSRNFNPTAT